MFFSIFLLLLYNFSFSYDFQLQCFSSPECTGAASNPAFLQSGECFPYIFGEFVQFSCKGTNVEWKFCLDEECLVCPEVVENNECVRQSSQIGSCKIVENGCKSNSLLTIFLITLGVFNLACVCLCVLLIFFILTILSSFSIITRLFSGQRSQPTAHLPSNNSNETQKLQSIEGKDEDYQDEGMRLYGGL